MARREKTIFRPVSKRIAWPPGSLWFLLATVSLALFLAYSFMLGTGALNVATFRVEQWLLQRPITRLDCLFVQWQGLGEAPVSLFLTLLLGGVCLWLGYRKRVVCYLLLIMLLCVGIEIIGKMLLSQPLSHDLRGGMMVLSCPQMTGQPLSTRISAMAGLWWQLPTISPALAQRAQAAAQAPVSFDAFSVASSYPSGHAMRWSFLGLVTCWLCGRHVKQPVLHICLTMLALLVMLGGGLMVFYIGVHLIMDIIAGYVCGVAAACCALGLLTLNSPRSFRG